MKMARIFLDNGEEIDVKLGDLFVDTAREMLQKHIIDDMFFKAYDEYIVLSHIIKIKIWDEWKLGIDNNDR